ncbi:MAG: hypothetical protein U9Q07_09165 [Planctomycetota bacterium]|nr:hypothetical protein [Planctomycetota bacterium]
MNRLLRTLTIIAVMTLSVATLAPAQLQSEGAVVGPVSQANIAAAAAAPGESKSEVAPQQYVQTVASPPPNTPPSRSGRSTSYRSSSSAGRSSGYGTSSSSYRRSSSSPVSRSKRQVFIIPAAEIERKDHFAIERDIHVMSHIFDRVLKKPVNKIGGVFTVMDDFFGRDSHVTQVIYADGYGALFFMDVDFALVGPPPASEAKEPNAPEEKVDTAWKQAMREVYERERPNVTRNTESRPGPEYDAEKVELLKRNLVETLKHAANIQALKSDESVILTVTGGAILSKMEVDRGKDAKWIFRSGKWVPVTGEPRTPLYMVLRPSVLTIRAKKSDIDAFSKGELDFNKFYERTQLLANWSGSTGATSTRGATSARIDQLIQSMR